MSFKKLSTAAALFAGLTITASASANEVSLEQLVAATMSQVVQTTKQELGNKVQKAVLTANNMIAFDESEMIAATVTITDLEVQKEMPSKAE